MVSVVGSYARSTCFSTGFGRTRCSIRSFTAASDEASRAGFPTAFSKAFRQGLHELGYVEGRNIDIEFRCAEGHYDRLPRLAAELVRLKVNVLVAAGPNAIQAAQQATERVSSNRLLRE
jgi:hypothetical protein